LGLGATYDLNKMESGKYTLDNNDSGLSSKVEDHYSIYLQPTYALNDSTSLFVKVGYHSVKSTIDDSVMQFFLLPKTTKTLNGLGYGFGITTFLNANLFVKTEIGFVDYGSTAIAAQGAYTKHELTSTSGTVSLGYKF
jgi:opacity protein-like surface antigen